MHPDLAEIFRAVQLPSNVGALTQAVAVKIAREVGVIPSRVELCARERERVSRALREIDTIEVHPSVTNFILFRLKEGKPADVHARFLEKGGWMDGWRSEEHTSELQSQSNLVCRLLLEKKNRRRTGRTLEAPHLRKL